ncbi:hypothetical protein DL771_007596 [Monosporascus sp. 5C6A]|nr:hypothetical protein DL771_007596 [Monosporascus sp. 5C6A]
MGHLITVATCNLNQWALDFEGNTKRIIESIIKAKEAGASLRVGPELEQCLETILKNKDYYDILLDIGMPVLHRNNRFNCRMICCNGKILLIRPKLYLAGDGNYREQRFFTPWLRPRHCEEYYLPRMIQALQGVIKVTIGDAVISTPDTAIGCETCEELFLPDPPHNHMSLNGVEVITNSSGSHFTLRKLSLRMQLIMEATRKNGACKAGNKQVIANRAQDLAAAIGAYHCNLDIDEVYQAQRNLIVNTLNFEPKFKVEGGSVSENLTLQNIQARSRMVTAYEFAQILPTTRGRPGGGSLLVLGSANVGESLRGYLTKYDCSSADINPIGSIDKSDLKRFIAWAEVNFNIPCLHDFLTAVPTAELEPITETYVQSDEADMGMTYDELTVFGRLRKFDKLGPYGMFQRLAHEWGANRPRANDDTTPVYTPRQVAEKVKRFFHYYAINRHKLTTLTPALHCNDYSPDDNRFDLRPFLYPPFYQSLAFKCIDRELEKMEGSGQDVD